MASLLNCICKFFRPLLTNQRAYGMSKFTPRYYIANVTETYFWLTLSHQRKAAAFCSGFQSFSGCSRPNLSESSLFVPQKSWWMPSFVVSLQDQFIFTVSLSWLPVNGSEYVKHICNFTSRYFLIIRDSALISRINVFSCKCQIFLSDMLKLN